MSRKTKKLKFQNAQMLKSAKQILKAEMAA